MKLWFGLSVPTQVDFGKLRNKLHSFAQMYWEPEAWQKKLETQEMRTLNTTSSAQTATTCIFFHSLSFYYSMWYKKSIRKSDFCSKTRAYSVGCCVIVMSPIGDSHQNSDKVYCDSATATMYMATTNVQNNCYCYRIPGYRIQYLN